MKAIAEYFRDLAADDRYFGAEPPTPDAAMLHRIAEREIQRRVEAQIQDNGVILRAGDAAQALPGAGAGAGAGVLAPAAPAPAAGAGASAAPAPAAPGPAAPDPADSPIAESVAAKLARIRAAVDRSRPAARAAAGWDDAGIEDAEEVVPSPGASAAPVVAEPEAGAFPAEPAHPVEAREPEAEPGPEAGAAPAAETAPGAIAGGVADEGAQAPAAGDFDIGAFIDTMAGSGAGSEAGSDEAGDVLAPAGETGAEETGAAFSDAEAVAVDQGAADEAEAPGNDIEADEPGDISLDALIGTMAATGTPREDGDDEETAGARAGDAPDDLADDPAHDLATPEEPAAEDPATAGETGAVSGETADGAGEDEHGAEENGAAFAEAVGASVYETEGPDGPAAAGGDPAAADVIGELADETAEADEPAAAGDDLAAADAIGELVDETAEADETAAEEDGLADDDAIGELAEEVAEAEEAAEEEDDLAADETGGELAEETAEAEEPAAGDDGLADDDAGKPADGAEEADVLAAGGDDLAARAGDTQEDAAEAEAASAEEIAAGDTPAGGDDDGARPVRARIVRVRRVERGAAATPRPDSGLSDGAIAAARGSLSPEQEDDLARELAEVERDVEASRAEAALRPPVVPGRPAARRDAPDRDVSGRDASGRDVSDPAGPDRADLDRPDPDRAGPEPGPDSAARSGAPEDAAVARLLRQTDTEMQGPENRRRVATLSHLKAAVAATIADRLMPGRRSSAADEADPYRDDLAQAVRPPRPGAGQPRPPGQDRAPPLVLVSEQRIDRPAPEQPAIQQMRRSSGSLALDTDADDLDDFDAAEDGANIFQGERTFARFAARLDAIELTDRIEAAAAWITAVEDREDFTRPELLRLVQSILPEGERYEREDGLRGFGTLLREGRIGKSQRGRFVLSPQSRLLAKARDLPG